MKNLLTALCALITASALANPLTTALDSVFLPVFDKPHTPGAAIVIARGDSILYERYLGLATLSPDSPVTAETQFCIASVSKQFAAVALMQLAERGQLSLDDPLAKFFPEFKADFYKRITLRHILSHTSGIPDARPRTDRHFMLYADDYESPAYMDTLSYLNFEPGARYEYINPTYQLIYHIVERVTGISFENYMRAYVLGVADMNSSEYFNPTAEPVHAAHGYTPDSATGDYVEFDYGEETFYATKADGGLYTTPRDFLRWERALREHRVLGEGMLTEAYTPHVTIQPGANYGYRPHTGYGYGFFITREPGRPDVVYHTGDNGGFTIYAGKVPARDIVVLIFSTRNDYDRMDLADRALDVLTTRLSI